MTIPSRDDHEPGRAPAHQNGICQFEMLPGGPEHCGMDRIERRLSASILATPAQAACLSR